MEEPTVNDVHRPDSVAVHAHSAVNSHLYLVAATSCSWQVAASAKEALLNSNQHSNEVYIQRRAQIEDMMSER